MRAAPFRPAEGAFAATSRSIPFSYLGVDGRLGCLLRVHGQLASVLLLDGPEPPPVVALGAARGREAREGFLGLAHDSRKVSGERNEKSFARDRAKEKKGRAKSERLEGKKRGGAAREPRRERGEIISSLFPSSSSKGGRRCRCRFSSSKSDSILSALSCQTLRRPLRSALAGCKDSGQL